MNAAPKTLNILHLEDNKDDAALAETLLHRAGFQCAVQVVDSQEEFIAAITKGGFDLIISDHSLPSYNGKAALQVAREKVPDTPFIFFSGTIGEEAAIDSLLNGATDYVLKNRVQRFIPAVQRALREIEERRERRLAQEALRESEEKYRLLWETTTDAVILMGEDRRIRYTNTAVKEMFGYAPEEITGKDIAIIQPERLREAHRRGMQRYLETGVRKLNWRATEVVGLHRDGHEFPVEVAFTHIRIGSESMFAAFIRDLTERKRVEQALQEREERFRQLAENIRDVFWIIAADTGDEIYTSPAYEQVWGRSLQSLHKNPKEWLEAIHPEDRPRVEEYLAIRDQNVPAFEIEYRVVRPDGSIRWVHDRAFPVQNKEGRTYRIVGIAEDITERRLQEEKLNTLAYYDPVTGLPNRALCFERLAPQLMAERAPTALLLVDIQRFRIINDTYGRREGDALLKQVGARLREALPGSAELARISADCFALTLIGVTDEAAIVDLVEQQVTRALRRPFKLWGDELRIAVKVGIALIPRDGADAETLFRNAEAALLRAKGSGEGYLFYALEMNAKVAEKLALENKLRLALEKQQFVLHYQPKVNVRDRQVSGVEALLRWQDPHTGLVPPAKFIPLLEETGLILDVGDWVIRQALADARGWAETGRHPRIAVNVSQVQLRRKDFVDSVRRALADQPGPAPSLDMEITESLIMENIEDNIAKLKALRALGIEIAVDDFGTGYSSLGYLAKLPVNALKIDRSFIINMPKHPDSMTIVSTIISLAHSLNLRVIAEGVDSEEQAKFLALLKCDEMQGYLFSKPLPPGELVTLMEESNKAE